MKKLLTLLLLPVAVLAVDNTYTTTTTSTSSSTVNSTSNTTSNSTVSHKDQPVGGARAPSMSVTNSDVCVSAVSGGAQSNVIGLSFGSTVVDENCERLKLSRELRKSGMKVASVAILCQDPRVFEAMINSGTPCPAKGQIGDDAKVFWNTYPELRPDYKEYQQNLQTLIDAGYLDKNGNLIVGGKDEETSTFKSSDSNWN